MSCGPELAQVSAHLLSGGWLPVGLVNADKGAVVGGKQVNLGSRITESIKKFTETGGRIDWKAMDEKEVKEELGEGKLYGALVVPADFTASTVALTGTSTTGTPARPALAVLTNQSAGSLGSRLARSATTQAAESVSLQVGRELTARTGRRSCPPRRASCWPTRPPSRSRTAIPSPRTAAGA